MVEALVTFILQKWSDQLLHQPLLLYGVIENVEWIHGELQYLKPFLNDREREEPVASWVQLLKWLVFESEDAIDEFMAKTELQSCIDNGRILCSMEAMNFNSQQQLSNRFMRVRRELEEVHKGINVCGLKASTRKTKIPFFSSRLPGEFDLVGRGRDLKQVEEWLLGGEGQQLVMISLVGVAGSGKTRLAKKAYQFMERHFDCFAWVFVSESVNIKDLLQKILQALYKSREEKAPDGIESMKVEKLQGAILNYLQGKRYGLVLDDIWEVGVWEELKSAFPLEGNGRIIFTTINASINLDKEVFHVHMLKTLSNSPALELFCKKSFNGECPKYLKELAIDMVTHCHGLPLAVVALGGLMARMGTDQTDWKTVLEDLNGAQNLVGSVNQVLLTCYNFLGPHLKYCFLYCSLFPKGYEITRNTFIKLFVGEGFVEELPGKTPEDVAGDYFVELADRGMLEPIMYYYDSNLRRCRMHDIVHDFANQMLEKEDFGVIHSPKITKFSKWVRRVGVHNDTIGALTELSKFNLRSLIMTGIHQLPSYMSEGILSHKLLRVLVLEDVTIDTLPEEVGNLIHLRYLSIVKSGIKALPASIGKLQNLLSLLAEKTKVTSLPAEIALLQKLRHIVVGDYAKRVVPVPNGIKNLSNLQILFGVKIDFSFMDELCSLTQLRKLDVGEVKDGDELAKLCNSVQKMQCLRHLAIRMSSSVVEDRSKHQELRILLPPPCLEDLYFNGSLKEVPKWVASLNTIRMVQLVGAKLMEDPFSIFCQLPNLVYLGLEEAYMGTKLGCSARAFPKLRSLDLAKMERVEEWSDIKEGSFQKLEYLTIGGCKKLKRLPQGFQELKALQRLLLVNMPEEFVRRVSIGGEDHLMVQQVPRILVSHKYDDKMKLFCS
ncbi:putative disease resistance protein At1g50180 [Macadamia integrifolia]|uniref:putative disease resistance protein At1g50180 n=1 Tax=Macadamia integrifolia TaxID=60698 RepID=UPI001C52DE4B|nr:putative disease resistance protein At1g50180 [Macadamia integrifolia]